MKGWTAPLKQTALRLPVSKLHARNDEGRQGFPRRPSITSGRCVSYRLWSLHVKEVVPVPKEPKPRKMKQIPRPVDEQIPACAETREAAEAEETICCATMERMTTFSD